MQLDQENNLSVYSEFACDKDSVGTVEIFFFVGYVYSLRELHFFIPDCDGN